ncbi:VOC family protein [Phyllobacterium myrsinacearum]|uniref:Catechol 2,3-dioxygenase-like lactoylglutathione lyase family enzyme n=1 Tax=Phyllobacterium myrsinacearum TaxID=28101 RepID=A0A839EE87_9HYPH|nr:VOC family protein [Phyllobacterium myrsinacearum]MBA8876728.1 catechol 2,3-dioxygenase-like lactoylglutathione lyase family enzyme [Phyllobacterium myrsinacearum]
MANPNLMILYVADAPASRTFYADLLKREPLEETINFAMFALDSGLLLGVWAREKVEPAVTSISSGTELVFSVETDGEVNATHKDWAARGLRIVQAPVHMDFGYTFVALDLDGHRLRMFAATPEGAAQ